MKRISTIQIAERIAPGDRWRLVNEASWMDENESFFFPKVGETIYSSMTEVIEAFFQIKKTDVEYLLNPGEGKIFIVDEVEDAPPNVIEKIVEVEVPPKPKNYSFYGENFKQGI